jgi:hypothetical protein
MSSRAACSCVIQTLNFGVSIAIIVFIARIYNATKSPLNPIEQYEQYQYVTNRLLLYSPESPTLKNDAKINKYCQCGDEFLSHICTEEQIISGCYDITPNEQKNLLRNLVDAGFCEDIKNQISIHKRLSPIFTLNYGSVNKMALGMLIVCCGLLGVIVLTFISFLCICCCQEQGVCFLLACAPIILIVALCGGVADIVLFIIMLVKYYKGRTTGEFIQYYEECEPFDKKKLDPVYSVVKPMQGYMTAFVVLNCIGIFLNYLGAILNKQNSAQNQ